MSALTTIPRSFIPPQRRSVHFAESNGALQLETPDATPEAAPEATPEATQTDGQRERRQDCSPSPDKFDRRDRLDDGNNRAVTSCAVTHGSEVVNAESPGADNDTHTSAPSAGQDESFGADSGTHAADTPETVCSPEANRGVHKQAHTTECATAEVGCYVTLTAQVDSPDEGAQSAYSATKESERSATDKISIDLVAQEAPAPDPLTETTVEELCDKRTVTELRGLCQAHGLLVRSKERKQVLAERLLAMHA